MLKEGLNAEKSCSCSKQDPVPADLTKSGELSTSEVDAPSSLDPSTSGPESQPKMETDTVPTASGTSKNYMFKIGTMAPS